MGEALDLQKTLAALTAESVRRAVHHPVTCLGELRLEEDGTLRCPHNATQPGGDHRTKSCIDSSVAILLIELASNL